MQSDLVSTSALAPDGVADRPPMDPASGMRRVKLKPHETKDLSYQRYISDPSVSEEIEAKVRRLRHGAIDQCIVRPIKAAFAYAWRLARSKRKPVVLMSPDTVIEVKIARGQTRSFKNARGFEIRVDVGCLWITQHHDAADYVLNAGETFRVTRDGATLACAVTSSAVQLAYVPVKRPTPEAISDARPSMFPRMLAVTLSH